MKTCKECKKTKPITEFYKSPGMADGHAGKCKSCYNNATTERYANNREYYRAVARKRYKDRPEHFKAKKNPDVVNRATKKYDERYPERRKACTMLRHAIGRGEIVRGACVACGATERVQGHHEDYSKPLDVVWLCPPCHSFIHRLNE